MTRSGKSNVRSGALSTRPQCRTGRADPEIKRVNNPQSGHANAIIFRPRAVINLKKPRGAEFILDTPSAGASGGPPARSCSALNSLLQRSARAANIYERQLT